MCRSGRDSAHYILGLIFAYAFLPPFLKSRGEIYLIALFIYIRSHGVFDCQAFLADAL
jgi:hypothetical protein